MDLYELHRLADSLVQRSVAQSQVQMDFFVSGKIFRVFGRASIKTQPRVELWIEPFGSDPDTPVLRLDPATTRCWITGLWCVRRHRKIDTVFIHSGYHSPKHPGEVAELLQTVYLTFPPSLFCQVPRVAMANKATTTTLDQTGSPDELGCGFPLSNEEMAPPARSDESADALRSHWAVLRSPLLCRATRVADGIPGTCRTPLTTCFRTVRSAESSDVCDDACYDQFRCFWLKTVVEPLAPRCGRSRVTHVDQPVVRASEAETSTHCEQSPPCDSTAKGAPPAGHTVHSNVSAETENRSCGVTAEKALPQWQAAVRCAALCRTCSHSQEFPPPKFSRRTYSRDCLLALKSPTGRQPRTTTCTPAAPVEATECPPLPSDAHLMEPCRLPTLHRGGDDDYDSDGPLVPPESSPVAAFRRPPTFKGGSDEPISPDDQSRFAQYLGSVVQSTSSSAPADPPLVDAIAQAGCSVLFQAVPTYRAFGALLSSAGKDTSSFLRAVAATIDRRVAERHCSSSLRRAGDVPNAALEHEEASDTSAVLPVEQVGAPAQSSTAASPASRQRPDVPPCRGADGALQGSRNSGRHPTLIDTLLIGKICTESRSGSRHPRRRLQCISRIWKKPVTDNSALPLPQPNSRGRPPRAVRIHAPLTDHAATRTTAAPAPPKKVKSTATQTEAFPTVRRGTRVAQVLRRFEAAVWCPRCPPRVSAMSQHEALTCCGRCGLKLAKHEAVTWQFAAQGSTRPKASQTLSGPEFPGGRDEVLDAFTSKYSAAAMAAQGKLKKPLELLPRANSLNARWENTASGWTYWGPPNSPATSAVFTGLSTVSRESKRALPKVRAKKIPLHKFARSGSPLSTIPKPAPPNVGYSDGTPSESTRTSNGAQTPEALSDQLLRGYELIEAEERDSRQRLLDTCARFCPTRPRVAKRPQTWLPPIGFYEDLTVVPHPYGTSVFARAQHLAPRSSGRSEVPGGQLAEIVQTTMNYSELLRLAPSVKPLTDILTRREAFEALLLPDPTPSRGIMWRGLSRNMIRHLPDLVDNWHVASRLPRGATVKSSMALFTVPKKDGRLRLVMDCRKLNEVMTRPPRMPIPSIHEVIDKIMSSRFMWTCDAKSYFYNFQLGEAVSRYFAAKLAGHRGSFATIVMRRMAMGWSWAPFIAQSVSNALLQTDNGALGVAWLDNFIFCADTKQRTAANAQEFLDRVAPDKVNIPMDNYSVQPTTSGEVLGLHFDLESRTYKLAPSFVDKVPQVSDVSSRRTLFELVGALIWASYAKREPLCRRARGIDVLRRATSGAQTEWDTAFYLSQDDAQTLRDWRSDVVTNSPVHWKPPTQSTDRPTVWSDASDDMCAFILLQGDELAALEAGPPPSYCDHIFLKEAFAVHKTVQRLVQMKKEGGLSNRFYDEDGCLHFNLKCDNKGLVHAITRQLSSSPLLNQWMTEWLDHKVAVHAEWVPTDIQRADPLTRGVSLQSFVHLQLHREENLAKWRAARGQLSSQSSEQQQEPPFSKNPIRCC